MNGSNGDVKPPLTGLIDMGDPSFYDQPGALPYFDIWNLYPYPGSFGGIVLNVTWAQLQPTENGPLDTSAIDSAISAVQFYNALHGTDVGIQLRVWGGYTAPDWAKSIDGPPLTVTGPGTIDPGNTGPETIGRFWTADYINAWTSSQNQLAATYDDNPIIRGISNTAGASATDEPFSQVYLPQMPMLQAGGYNDAGEELTLRTGIADYSAWTTTPLDYTMSVFRLEDANNATPDPNFSLAVLQQAENSSRVVQASNHVLNNPLPSWALFLYAQITADAALNPATVPASYQTDYPANLGSYANWSNVIGNGAAADAGSIELWETPILLGFESKSPSSIANLATILANGVAPVTGAPDDGAALGFIAPSVVTSAPGTILLTGTNAVLLESADAESNYTVTVTSAEGNRLTATDNRQLLAGTELTLSGSLAAVNTILASLADQVASGTDTLKITATDGAGDSATETVGVIASAATASTSPIPNPATPPAAPSIAGGTIRFSASPAPITVAGIFAVGAVIVDAVVMLSGGSSVAVGDAGAGDVDIADQPATAGTAVVAGIDTSVSIAGNLDVGGTATSAGGTATLLAALSPDAYSTADLSIGGTLNVWGQGDVRMTGALGASAIDIASGGTISGDGTLSAQTIANDGTIEVVADQTLGLAELDVAAPLSGAGQIVIDAGAALTLGNAVDAGQTIVFSAPTIAQLSDGPYSPTTLMMQAPSTFAGTITGFSFASSLVLDGVDASAVSYSSGVLTVTPANGGTPLSFALSGDLAGLQPEATVSGSGSGAATTITFAAPGSGEAPGVVAPATLEAAPGIAVPVPDIVLQTPFPPSSPTDTTIDVTITAGSGALAAGTSADDATLTQNSPQSLTLTGTIDAVERSLQTLTYQGAAAGTDSITISVSDYAGTSAPATIGVTNGSAGAVYAWGSLATGSFGDPTQWTVNGGRATGAPGGADIASFGPGIETVTGDGAVAEMTDAGTLTLTGSVSALGLSGGTALSVDSGGALTLAGGAQLTAVGTAAVGVAGYGQLTVIGGALDLTGGSTTDALVIGENAGSAGVVLDFEEITAAGSAVIGAAGSGTLQLLGVAASASDGGADIGQTAGGSGTVVVNGGEWSTAGSLTVGDAGTGSLTIDGAANGITGQATAFDATIGAKAGSTGTVSLPGGDLLVANADASSSTLTVGNGGRGMLALSDAGNVTVGVALATVNNSTMVFNTGSLIVGAGGSGQISITTGASLEVDGNTTIGQSGGTGTVTVGESAADTGLFAMTGTLAIGSAGTVTLSGPEALVRASAVQVAAGGILDGAGTLSGVGGGNATVMLASITNDGTIAASNGTLLVHGSVAGTGTLQATASSSLTLQAAVAAGQTLTFGQNASVTLNDAGAFHGTIEGFSPSDTINIGSLPASATNTVAMGANNVLTITEGSQTYHLQFDPTQNFSNDTFTLSPDGSWGTSVTMVDPSENSTLVDASYGGQASEWENKSIDNGRSNYMWASYLAGGERRLASLNTGTEGPPLAAASGPSVLIGQESSPRFFGGSDKAGLAAASNREPDPSWFAAEDSHAGGEASFWGFIPAGFSSLWSAGNSGAGSGSLPPGSTSPSDYLGFANPITAGHIGIATGLLGGQQYLSAHIP